MTISNFEELTEVVLSDRLNDIQLAQLILETTGLLIYPFGEKDIDRKQMLIGIEIMLSKYPNRLDRPLFLKDFFDDNDDG